MALDSILIEIRCYRDLTACAACLAWSGSRRHRDKLYGAVIVIQNQHRFALLSIINQLL